jgi:oligopeptide/dipeptide ABC transporter ATP-binding protein
VLPTIPGAPPDLSALPPCCAFAPRCAAASAQCRATQPALLRQPGQALACWHPVAA